MLSLDPCESRTQGAIEAPWVGLRRSSVFSVATAVDTFYTVAPARAVAHSAHQTRVYGRGCNGRGDKRHDQYFCCFVFHREIGLVLGRRPGGSMGLVKLLRSPPQLAQVRETTDSIIGFRLRISRLDRAQPVRRFFQVRATVFPVHGVKRT